MRYAEIKANDTVNCDGGIVVSFWVQGCKFRCKGCHNQSTWNPSEGIPATNDTKKEILRKLHAHGIKRNFSVLGGEPLVEYNRSFVFETIDLVKTIYPETKVFLWTGYTLEELQALNDRTINSILGLIDVLIDGRYEEEKRDITLHLRGSSNQRILYRGEDF